MNIPDSALEYMRSGMRNLDVHRGGYAGASPETVQEIALGRRPTMNSRSAFEPVKIETDGPNKTILVDGRHRIQAAREAGAKFIAATYDGKPIILRISQ